MINVINQAAGRVVFCIVLFLFITSITAVFSEGRAEEQAVPADPFSEAVEQYNSGNHEAAAESFKRAATADDPVTAAAAYYNYGTVQAGMAEQSQDPGQKRELLESSYEALKRSVDIGTLPPKQLTQARRNMELVRESLSHLPEEQQQNEGQQGDEDKQEQQQGSDGQSSQQSGQQGEQGGESQQGTQQDGSLSPQDMLQQQRDLRNQTESGQGTDGELAEQQKQLQQASESAEMNEAALSQQKAAEALSNGDRQKAAEYQKAAEQALADAAGDEQSGEAEDILNREADQQAQRNRLDQSGGIHEADKNW